MKLLTFLSTVTAVELTFELPDKEEACFYEEIKENVQATLEFQVVEGGKMDVDCTITDPKQKQLYSIKRKEYDTYTWLTKVEGEYKICFSNQFSTFTHKVVYFDWQVGDDDDEARLFPDGDAKHAEALKSAEESTMQIYERLKAVIDFQTHHRLKEVSERRFAEDLRDRVQNWSLLQFVIMITVSMVQVLIVRSFFNAMARKRVRT